MRIILLGLLSFLVCLIIHILVFSGTIEASSIWSIYAYIAVPVLVGTAFLALASKSRLKAQNIAFSINLDIAATSAGLLMSLPVFLMIDTGKDQALSRAMYVARIVGPAICICIIFLALGGATALQRLARRKADKSLPGKRG